jgi:hypothetical protein
LYKREQRLERLDTTVIGVVVDNYYLGLDIRQRSGHRIKAEFKKIPDAVIDYDNGKDHG